MKGSNVAIKVNSDVDTLIYQNVLGELHHLGNKLIGRKVRILKEGDKFCVMLWESVITRENRTYSLCQFLLNGKTYGKSILLEGNDLRVTVFQDSNDTSVELNTDLGI